MLIQSNKHSQSTSYSLFNTMFCHLKPPLCFSSIVNLPGESTLRREFLRLQQENKNRSDPHWQQQQLKDQEKYKKQLLAERQKRIEQQKEQRRRLEDVGSWLVLLFHVSSQMCLQGLGFARQEGQEGCVKLSAQPGLYLATWESCVTFEQWF